MKRSQFDGELVRTFTARSALRAIARRAGHQDVDDVVQDAFVRVVETSKRQEVHALDHLLSKVVRRVAIDHFRRRSTRRDFAQGDDVERAVDPSADPERVLIGTQRLGRVLATIDEMPTRRREVFLLHRIDDLTYPQIARKLGISGKAVEKHIRLALKQLVESDD